MFLLQRYNLYFNAYKKSGAGKTEGEDRSKIRTGV